MNTGVWPLTKLIPWPPPVEHEQFCEYNRNSTAPCTNLILRGIIDLRFYAKGKSVWEKKRLLKDQVVWNLKVDVYPTDVVVYMHAFTAVGLDGLTLVDLYENKGAGAHIYRNGGPWLLRPAGNNEFKLIACLLATSHGSLPLYENWEWSPEPFQKKSANQCRPLAVDPVHKVPYATPIEDEDEVSAKTRDFIII